MIQDVDLDVKAANGKNHVIVVVVLRQMGPLFTESARWQYAVKEKGMYTAGNVQTFRVSY